MNEFGDVARTELEKLEFHAQMSVYDGEEMSVDAVRVPGGYLYITRYHMVRYSKSSNEDVFSASVSTSFVPLSQG